MHEFVLSGLRDEQSKINTLDLAKGLIDFGVHPPTIYFPLIIPEAMMIEPTGSSHSRAAQFLRDDHERTSPAS